MPGKARKLLIREGEIGVYHVWSRCVQQEFLCGWDAKSKTDFTHRRNWLEKLFLYQTQIFAIDLGTYSILSNHFHAVVRSRPDVVATWSDEEVAFRWKRAWPAWQEGRWFRDVTDDMVEEVLNDPKKLALARAGLSSVSWYMARIKEPISKLANFESSKEGHFWSGRFGSRELEDDAAVITCLAYVDANQVKAGLADSLENSRFSAISLRIAALRRLEAEASVEEFSKDKEPFHVYTVEQADAFLATTSLAPISASGPTFHDEALAAVGGARRPGAGALSWLTGRTKQGVGEEHETTWGEAESSSKEPAREEPAREEPAREEPAREGPAREEPAREEPARKTGEVVAMGEAGEVGKEPRTGDSDRCSDSVLSSASAQERPSAEPDGEERHAPRQLGEAYERLGDPEGDVPDGDVPEGDVPDGVVTEVPGSDREEPDREEPDQEFDQELPDQELPDHEVPDDGGSDDGGPDGGGPDGEVAEDGGPDDGGPEQEPRKSGEGGRGASTARRIRTREIARRLFPDGLPARNSDVPLVCLALLDYLQLILWVAHAKGLPPSPPPAGFSKIRCEPEIWLTAVENFEVLFHCAVGSERALEAIAARNNQKRLHGIRACRDVFG